jgi:sterol desaturase/sphingolipid hydroxylase (fatty acid hydroxylase superfamily)
MSQTQRRSAWNHTPQLPLKIAPFYHWPMRPLAIAYHLLQAWNPLAVRVSMLLIAIGVWTWATPSMDRMQVIGLDWVFEIWLRNLLLILAVAGGLHLYLFTFNKQGDSLRFDRRPMAKNVKAFLFRNQVWDNMFLSLVPAVFFWTAWEVVVMWAYANGWATMITFEDNPVWFIVLIIAIPIWVGFFFYFQHRFFHIRPCYKWVHSWHHKNQNTGPWSGLAMHPIEHLVLLSDSLIYLVVASHPIHLIFNLLHHGLGAPTSHAGFEGIKMGSSSKFQLGEFFHQLHHRFFDCNYGDGDQPWDHWLGTFHDGTPSGDEAMRERRKNLQTASGQ